MNELNVWLIKNDPDYWRAGWVDNRGNKRRKVLGPKASSTRAARKKKLSERQARVLCQRLAAEMTASPAKLNASRSPTMENWIKHYMSSRPDLTAGTLYLHGLTGRYLLEHFASGLRIDQMTRVAAREWQVALSDRGMADDTVAMHTRNAKTMFKRAVTDEVAVANPFQHLSGAGSAVDKNWAYIDRHNLTLLMRACPNTSWRMLLALCRLAGLRQGEAMALKWTDIDFDKGCMTVNNHIVKKSTKKKRRPVPIDPKGVEPGLREILNAAYMDGDASGERVVSEIQPSSGNLYRDFHVIRERAKVPFYEKWCHTLRKNCEQDWNDAGIPFYAVCFMLGHAPKVAAEHYLCLPDSVFTNT